LKKNFERTHKSLMVKFPKIGNMITKVHSIIKKRIISRKLLWETDIKLFNLTLESINCQSNISFSFNFQLIKKRSGSHVIFQTKSTNSSSQFYIFTSIHHFRNKFCDVCKCQKCK